MHRQGEGAIQKPSQATRLNETAVLQNNLQVRLTSLVNGQAKGRKDAFRALARPGPWRRKEAEKLVGQYEQLSTLAGLPTGPPNEVEIPLYRGQNQKVRRMMDYLAVELGNDLLGAYVHGSLGSNEEIAYSDFDALVIPSEEVLRSTEKLSRTVKRTAHAQAFMLEQDPLQHHGWFVLTPYDLTHFCDAYFPAVLFRYAKSLLPNHGKQLQLFPRDASYETRQSFVRLAASILHGLEFGNYQCDLYHLKGLLSQFMLLPSLYVRVRDGQSVWKADSFGLARTDFDADVWAVMDHVSAIRRIWPASFSPFQRWKAKMPPPIVQKTRRWAAPRVPDAISKSLNGSTCSGMKELVHRMIERLG